MNLPMITVIIPAHNRERTIGYCLQSVHAQTYSDFEIVVVDDGSQDETAKKVLEFNDSRIRLLRHNTSKGAQAARNTGIRAAHGKWIAFLDSDDEWYPHKLAEQVAALTSRDWDDDIVVHGGMTRYCPQNNSSEPWELPVVAGKSCYAALLHEPGPLFPTLMVSKKALQAIGYLDERVPSYQEWDTAIRLAKICEFIHIKEPLAIYWLHEGDTISKNKRRDVDGYRYIIEKHRTEIEGVLGKKAWLKHCAVLINRYAKFGFFYDARQLLRQLPIISYWRFVAGLVLLKAFLTHHFRRHPA